MRQSMPQNTAFRDNIDVIQRDSQQIKTFSCNSYNMLKAPNRLTLNSSPLQGVSFCDVLVHEYFIETVPVCNLAPESFEISKSISWSLRAPSCEASALGVIYAQIRKAALRKLEHHRFQGSSKKSCCSIVASVEHRSREPSRSARTSAVVAAIGLVTFRTQQAWRALRSIHKQIGSLLESLLAPLSTGVALQ